MVGINGWINRATILRLVDAGIQNRNINTVICMLGGGDALINDMILDVNKNYK